MERGNERDARRMRYVAPTYYPLLDTHLRLAREIEATQRDFAKHVTLETLGAWQQHLAHMDAIIGDFEDLCAEVAASN